MLRLGSAARWGLGIGTLLAVLSWYQLVALYLQAASGGGPSITSTRFLARSAASPFWPQSWPWSLLERWGRARPGPDPSSGARLRAL